MPSDEPRTLFPMPLVALRPVPDDEVEELIAGALRAGGGPLSRAADLALSCSCARLLADKFALAGYVVCRAVAPK